MSLREPTMTDLTRSWRTPGRPAAPALGVPRAPVRGQAWAAVGLALGVSALLVLAEQTVTQWTDALLFVAWLLLWGVVFVATALIDRWRRLPRPAAVPLPGAEPALAPANLADAPADAEALHSRYGESLPYF